MQRFAKSGVRIVSGIEKDGPVRYAFIHDPWATLIEVVEDPEIRGFHHIHLASDNPKTTLKWYTDVFGGRVGRFAGLIGGIRYGDTWVLVKGVARPPAPTKGRALDHLVWPVADFDASVKRLEATNARIETRPADSSLFVVSPDSVQLKLERRVAE
jgi:catechol 2,3-dioxygenase-like lactoylglutathione lyase family enzyme